MTSLKVAAYTKGLMTPSARFRIRQQIPFLEQQGISVKEFPSLFSSYPQSSKFLLPVMAAAALASRVPDIIKGYRCDVSILQREMLSMITTLEPLVKRPVVLDVDDAIFLRRGGKAARRLAKLAEHVICGNDFVAEYFRSLNPQVSVIPTAIDTNRYVPVPVRLDNRHQGKVIGWMGTKSNFKYLYQIESALEKVVSLQPEIRLKIVADESPVFARKLNKHLDYIPWCPDRDVSEIQSMSVGIMPLSNGDWERGKCSFKMLQYMACGIPVVVSPVGMNSQILAMGEIGYSAVTEGQWVEGILQLINDTDQAQAMGKVGRSIVEEHFTIEKISFQVAEVLQSYS